MTKRLKVAIGCVSAVLIWWFGYIPIPWVRTSTVFYLHPHMSPRHDVWIGFRPFRKVAWEAPHYHRVDANTILLELKDGVRIVEIQPFKEYHFATSILGGRGHELPFPSGDCSRDSKDPKLITFRLHRGGKKFEFDLRNAPGDH